MKVEDGHIRKGFIYNTCEDQDIHDWLNNLPARKHSEYIRKAIRHFMHTEQPQPPQRIRDGNSEHYAPQEEIETIKQRLSRIEEQLIEQTAPVATITKNEQKEENRYINAPDILQNLGR